MATTYADTIQTDRGPVRLSNLRPEQSISINGRRIKASQIPLSYYTLECGHKGQGIAVQAGNTIFCETCKSQKTVSRSRG